MTHTPTPWRACKKGKCKCGQIWSLPADTPVLTVETGPEWGDSWHEGALDNDGQPIAVPKFSAYGAIPDGAGESNAARIVACVNACDGIDNMALHAGVIAELVKVAHALASKEIPERPNGNASHYAIPHYAIEIAKTALAKLGQTP